MAAPSSLYEALNHQSREIRLVRLEPRGENDDQTISCKLSTFDLNEGGIKIPTYKALSYAWGSDTKRSMTVNGIDTEVGVNLHEFFKVFRSWQDSSTIWLWVDQLCINQQSNTERTHQVGLMDQIYTNAEETLVWLGLDDYAGRAFATMRQVNEDLKYKGVSSIPVQLLATLRNPTNAKDDAKHTLHSLEGLFLGAYWQRHWVLQELVLSRRRTLLYGAFTLDWEDFVSAAHALEGSMDYDTQDSVRRILALASAFAQREHAFIWYRCTRCTTHTLCHDIRDKVYGIQSLLPPDFRIEADYTLTVQEVYARAVLRRADGYLEDKGFIDGCVNLSFGMDVGNGYLTDALGAWWYRSTPSWTLTREDKVKILRWILQTFLLDYDPGAPPASIFAKECQASWDAMSASHTNYHDS